VPLELAHERIFRLGDFFELSRRTLTDQLLGAYSKGMRRKVIIASALLHDPSVVIFDEPLDGLDPMAAIAFKGLIHALAGQGKTIIYSSHLLDVVERLCDRVIILDHGRLAMDGSPAELLAAGQSSTLEKLFAQITGATEMSDRALDVAKALTGRGAKAE
jgi:ABC-2 type transport system ATP-binding protein